MSNPSDNNFAQADLDAIVAETFVRRVDFHRQIGSTNDRATQLAADGGDFPLLVLAEAQTAGRGRGANVWWSTDGALTFSVVLATNGSQLPTERWPQVSLTVGLAVAEALEELLAQGVPPASRSTLPTVQLKWPNDVYVEGRKICGILIEVPSGVPGKLVVGIGLNVNNSVADAPDDISALATSLRDLTGRLFSRTEVLILALQRLDSRLSPDDFWTDQVAAGWRERCYLTGKSLCIDNGTRQTEGICHGIDPTGALLLEVEGQVEKHLAGAITVV